MKVAILGSGAFGTALAVVLGAKGVPVALLTRSEARAGADPAKVLTELMQRAPREE